MGRRATSSEGRAPESTAVVSQKTGRSLQKGTKSEASALTPDVARPSSTRRGLEFSFDGDEPGDYPWWDAKGECSSKWAIKVLHAVRQGVVTPQVGRDQLWALVEP